LNLFETARLFALVDLAMADAYIAGWDSNSITIYGDLILPSVRRKRITMTVQPKIQLWEPAMPTPPVQDYPSTHSALGNAAATVIAKILGDDTAFTMDSPTKLPGNGGRSFTNVGQAADENADSRVLAGIHFRFACDAGQELGDKIGNWVVENHLKPLK
jgi:hypothetical protein